MKRLTFTMILTCLAGLIFSQQALLWNESKAVRQGTNIEWNRAATNFGNNVVYTWSDIKSGSRDVYAQMVDPNGNCPWGNSPIVIDNKADNQQDPVVVTTSDNCLIFAWVDYSQNSAGEIYAQKVNASGELFWPTGGVVLCNSLYWENTIMAVPDLTGGAFVVWNDKRNPSRDIYGQHLNSNGTLAWQVNGIQFGDSIGEEFLNSFMEDGQGNAVLAYKYKNPSNNFEDLKVLKVRPEGTFAWGPTFLCDAANDQNGVTMAPDGNGGFYFTWEDKRNDTDADIYAQHLDTNGNPTWANDLVIYSGQYIQKAPRIIAASNNTAIIVWEDYRLDPDHSTSDLLAQKINLQGEKLWATDGVIVCQENLWQQSTSLVSDENGGCIVVWDDSRTGDNSTMDVYAQHISSNGTMTWEVNGKAICNLQGTQNSSIIRKNADKIFVTWADQRDGSVGIYNQIMDVNGQFSLPQNGKQVFWGIGGNACDLHAVKSGTDVFAVWEDTRTAYFGYQIFMQKFNSEGDTLFAANGIPITSASGNDQINLEIISDGEGGFIASWMENPNGSYKVFAQRIDSNGNRLWGEHGLNLAASAVAFEHIPPKIQKIGADYNIVWTDYRTDYINKIYEQKITNGQIQWDSNGKLICSNGNDVYLRDFQADYLVWEQFNWSEGTGFDIHVLKITPEGNPASGWPVNGLQITNAPEYQYNPQALIIPQGLLVVYQDTRNLNNKDLYAQLVTPQGQIVLQENGYPLVTLPNDQQDAQIYWDGNLKIAWSDYRNGLNNEIAMNKWSLQGNTLVPEWGNTGILITQRETTQQNPVIAKFDNKMLVCWEDVFLVDESYSDSDIKAKVVDEQGVIYDGGYPEGLIVSNDPKKQYVPIISAIDDQRAYILWTDGRSSCEEDILNVYIQGVNVPLHNTDVEQTNKNTLSAFNYPNPFNPSTTIEFNVPATQKVTLDIYNIKGQKVTSLWNRVTEKGVHRVNWNGKDSNNKNVSSGMYLYKLSCGKGSLTRKVILMK